MKAENAEEIRRLVDGIFRHLKENEGGYKDDLAKRTLLGLVGSIEAAGGEDDYIRGQCGEIREYADVLFSARGRKGYPDASSTKSFILADCYKIKMRVDTLAGEQENED